MKAYKILLFIFSVIAALGLLCSFFPSEGLQVGPVSLEFPSLEDILVGEEDIPAVDPEELIQNRLQAIEDAERETFMEYIKNDPARFHFPGGDITMFDPLFEAFDSADSLPVRIVHYGDSQIEEDRISSTLRKELQTRFGGGGSGLLPIREEYYSLSISETSTFEPVRRMVYGSAELRAGHNRYGPMGQLYHIDSTLTVSVAPIKSNTGPARYFNRVTLLAGNKGRISVSCKGDRRAVEATETLNMVTFNLPDSSTRASVTISGSTDLYGIMLDNDKGISLDNIGMRGCSGTIFTSINAAQLKEFYKATRTRLIILQYGGNSVPYLKSEKAISTYKTNIEKHITHLKTLAPDAVILFIGPSDMATNVKGKMQTYPYLPMVVDSLKAAANNSGAVFWDMYSAMGGEGSMVRWVKSSPALAGSDYVHFTPRGAESMGDILSRSMMLYYDYYSWRKENED